MLLGAVLPVLPVAPVAAADDGVAQVADLRLQQRRVEVGSERAERAVDDGEAGAGEERVDDRLDADRQLIDQSGCNYVAN